MSAPATHLHGHTDVGALEGGGVVHTVTGHAALVAAAAEGLDDQELVLGVHL